MQGWTVNLLAPTALAKYLGKRQIDILARGIENQPWLRLSTVLGIVLYPENQSIYVKNSQAEFPHLSPVLPGERNVSELLDICWSRFWCIRL